MPARAETSSVEDAGASGNQEIVASPRREGLTTMLNALQETLLTASLSRMGLDGNNQLSKWTKALGRFGCTQEQAADLFEALDVDADGSVSASEFGGAIAARPVTSVTSQFTESMSLIQFLRLKYRMILAGMTQCCEVSEKANLNTEGVVTAFQRLDFRITEDECTQIIQVLLGRQHMHGLNKRGGEGTIPVPVLCHQLAIEGTTVSALHARTLMLVKHKLLQAVFMTIDKDRSAAVNLQELTGLLERYGVSKEDAQALFEHLFEGSVDAEARRSKRLSSRGPFTGSSSASKASESSASTSKPSNAEQQQQVSLAQFCRAMAMDEGTLRLSRQRRSARSILAFSRCRRRLLSAALSHIDVDANKELDFDEWVAALGSLEVAKEAAGEVFVLLDVNHDMSLSLNEVEQILIGKFEDGEDFQAQEPVYDRLCDAWLGVEEEPENKTIFRRCLNLYGNSELTWRERLEKIVRSPLFDMSIAVLICLNAVTIGIETNQIHDGRVGYSSQTAGASETFFTVVFLLEAVLKITALGRQYFYDKFNLFDFFLVNLSVFDVWVVSTLAASSADTSLRSVSVLRIFRVLRVVKVFRVVKIFRELRLLVSGVIAGIRTLTWTMVLLMIVLYVCAIFATHMLGPHGSPDTSIAGDDLANACFITFADPSCFIHEYFGSVERSMLTMFQIMTLDAWGNEIVRPVERIMPYMWIFFVAFICFSTFVILNLVTGVFLDQTLTVAKEDQRTEMERLRRQRQERIAKLKEMFEAADTDDSGELTETEFAQLVEDPNVLELFQNIGYEPSELSQLFRTLDVSGEGFVDLCEFVDGMLKLQREVKMADLIQILTQQRVCVNQLEAMQQKLSGIEDLLQRLPVNGTGNGFALGRRGRSRLGNLAPGSATGLNKSGGSGSPLMVVQRLGSNTPPRESSERSTPRNQGADQASIKALEETLAALPKTLAERLTANSTMLETRLGGLTSTVAELSESITSLRHEVEVSGRGRAPPNDTQHGMCRAGHCGIPWPRAPPKPS